MARRDDGDSSTAATIAEGAAVQVRTRFDGRWASGFDVAEIVATPAGGARYRLRRAADGSVLPVLFEPGDVMAAAPG